MLNPAILRRRRWGGNPLAAYTLGGNTASITLDFANDVYQSDGVDVAASTLITGNSSAFEIAGATMPTFDSGIWVIMKGRITYADNDTAYEKYFFQWKTNGTILFQSAMRTDGGTGRLYVDHFDGSNFDANQSGGNVYTPGTDVPFSIAIRASAPDLQIAVEGVASAANETLVGHPDLSSRVFYGGLAGLDTWSGEFDLVMIGTGDVTAADLEWASDADTSFPNSGSIPMGAITYGGDYVTHLGDYVTYG